MKRAGEEKDQIWSCLRHRNLCQVNTHRHWMSEIRDADVNKHQAGKLGVFWRKQPSNHVCTRSCSVKVPLSATLHFEGRQQLQESGVSIQLKPTSRIMFGKTNLQEIDQEKTLVAKFASANALNFFQFGRVVRRAWQWKSLCHLEDQISRPLKLNPRLLDRHKSENPLLGHCLMFTRCWTHFTSTAMLGPRWSEDATTSPASATIQLLLNNQKAGSVAADSFFWV